MHALVNRNGVGMVVAVGLLLGLWLSTVQAAVQRADERRVALVVGNDAYDAHLRLRTSVNDAAAVSAALRRLGFTVTRLDNAGQAVLRQSLQAFMHDASGSDIALVFYSGHGTGVDGRNFLIPVDIPAGELDVPFETVPLDLAMHAVSKASRLGLVILDADCPNRVEPLGETVVACAGQMTMEGPDANTTYTSALLRYLEEPGLEIGLLFSKVRDAVLASTEGRQVPIVYGSLPRNYHLTRRSPSLPSADTASVADSREVGHRGAQRLGLVPEHIRNQEGFDASESAGLFVGIRNFSDEKFAEVPYAVDDAVDLAHLFAVELALIAPERVTLALAGEPKKDKSKLRLQALLEAGAKPPQPAAQANIYEQLEASRKATGERGILVLSMATHGFMLHNGQNYLVGADSRFSRIERTGILAAEVFDEIARAQAPRRLVLLDACRERLSSSERAMGGVDPESAMGAAFAKAIAEASGQVVLFGATTDGYSYDDMDRGNGVFTGAVLDGLRGAAPAAENGFITLETLADYVHGQVLQWVRENRPAHVDKSQGITRHVEGSMMRLALAINPDAAQRRQEEALQRLRDNFGGPITGSLYDVIARALDSSLPSDLRAKLLDEIEALDGSDRPKRSLAYFVDEYRGDLVSYPQPPIPTRNDR